jgi:4'-phosphopantetheinyl transferase
MWEHLSAEERTRAGRFHFQKDRDRFVSRRGFRRVLLARYVGVEPEDLEFRSSVLGKPQLAPIHGSLRFSASSSGDLILVGVTAEREIGVDIQQAQARLFSDGMIDRYHFPRAVGDLRLVGNRQMDEFFRHWALKEALAKAKGTGLALELDGALTGMPSALPEPNFSCKRSSWSAVHLWPKHGYAAAIVVGDKVGSLSCWKWEGGPRRAYIKSKLVHDTLWTAGAPAVQWRTDEAANRATFSGR